MPEIEPLAWDTAFFGFPVARLRPTSSQRVPQLVDEARRQGVRLVYWFAQPGDAAAAASMGASVFDERVTFTAAAHDAVADPAIRPVSGATPELEALALQSGHSSRFRRDPRLPEGSFERMYSAWLAKSLSGELAREVLVFGNAEGFITVGVKGQRLDIGLLAVDARARGRGVGRSLVTAAFARAQSWGVPVLQVATQLQNRPACELYRACGFRVESIEPVYHLWL